ncbi:hypothetical protein LCGC14_2859210, partial [marine sediment metagenome]
VLNNIKPIAERAFAGVFGRTFGGPEEGSRRDKRTLSIVEQITVDIHGDNFVGLIGERKAYLAQYAALTLQLTQERYMGLKMTSVFVDDRGDVSGHAGAAILLDRDRQHYTYKVEDKRLVLYKRSRKTNGEYEWVAIPQPSVVKAEEEAVTDAATAKERQTKRTAADVVRKTERAEAQEEAQQFYGAGPGGMILVRAEWTRDDLGWWNTRNEIYAKDSALIKRLNDGDWDK